MASLLRPEQVEELRQIFDLFDSDGDGLLEVEEVGAIWASCGTLLTEAEVHKKNTNTEIYMLLSHLHTHPLTALPFAPFARAGPRHGD